MITWLHYVSHNRILLFLARGWEIADELHGTNHGNYAVLMRWPYDGDPPHAH